MEEYKTQQGQFPQFGASGQPPTLIPREIQERIETAKSNGWGAQLSQALLRNKKGALIAIAVVLLFALGSYMSKNNEESPDNTPKNEIALPAQGAVLPIELNEQGEVVIAQEEKGGELSSLANISSITKTAGQGEGITHLARYALRDYLEETGKSLTGEQKIYAEDYVQNKTGEELLDAGESLSFTRSLLAEAVQRAQALEQWQIENLTQYSATVSLL